MKYIRIISRILVGLVLIFSGFVKLVDPLGSTYKFVDYFQAFHLGFLEPAAIYLAVTMSLAEFVIGVSLLVGLRMRIASWAVLIFMSFFTILTFFLALYNPVTDCGCFGDALVITNWQTFGKNIIIMVFVIIVFISRNKFNPVFKVRGEWAVVSLFALFGLWFSIYCYNHLPIIDFRPYKTGTNITEAMIVPESQKDNTDQYQTLLYYKKNGVVKEFNLKNMPDSTWKWVETKNILIKEGYHPPIHNFSITTKEGSEITDLVLSDTGYTFLLISYNIEKASRKHQKEVNDIAAWSQANNIGFKCLTSSTPKQLDLFKKETGATYEFFTTDEVTLKTIIRSNPGLLLFKKGTVMGIWHHNDLPGVKSLTKNLTSLVLNESRNKIEKHVTHNFILIFFLLLSVVAIISLYLKNRKLNNRIGG
ncbi:MAG: DoxX family protein [Bacteroidia bacterium]|nr:DoxX family protein [Bacteroidia bacterium]